MKVNIDQINTISIPEPKWSVEIPKGGDGIVLYHTRELNIWQRFWMRFIGWGVERATKHPGLIIDDSETRN